MTPEELLERFHQLVANDRQGGRVGSLAHYQGLFNGHEGSPSDSSRCRRSNTSRS